MLLKDLRDLLDTLQYVFGAWGILAVLFAAGLPYQEHYSNGAKFFVLGGAIAFVVAFLLEPLKRKLPKW